MTEDADRLSDTTLDTLDTQISAMEIQLATLKEQRNRFANGLFYRLPDEIITQALTWLQSLDYRAWVDIMLVCRKARKVALASPELWSTLVLRSPRLASTPRRVVNTRAWLDLCWKRRKGTPFSLELDTLIGMEYGPDVTKLLTRSRELVTNLRFTRYDFDWGGSSKLDVQIWKALHKTASVSKLEHIKLHHLCAADDRDPSDSRNCQIEDPDDEPLVLKKDFLKGATNLKTLHLTGSGWWKFQASNSLRLPSLRRLLIGGLILSGHFAELRECLVHSPLLESLALGLLSPAELQCYRLTPAATGTREVGGVVALPHLHVVELRGGSYDVSGILAFLPDPEYSLTVRISSHADASKKVLPSMATLVARATSYVSSTEVDPSLEYSVLFRAPTAGRGQRLPIMHVTPSWVVGTKPKRRLMFSGMAKIADLAGLLRLANSVEFAGDISHFTPVLAAAGAAEPPIDIPVINFSRYNVFDEDGEAADDGRLALEEYLVGRKEAGIPLEELYTVMTSKPSAGAVSIHKKWLARGLVELVKNANKIASGMTDVARTVT